ncbi:MAG: hypothetical protein JXA10_07820 [Anaerolineae bacterium]|nr:hypothetical protein [Anaerolineae bacterium]
MKRFYVVLTLLALLIPFTVMAQDDAEFETYTSEDGLLTVDYPAEWGFSVPEDVPFPSIAFIYGENGVERFEADEDMQSGDQAMMLLLMPDEFLGYMGLSVDAYESFADFAYVTVSSIMAPDETDPPEYAAALVVGEGEEITLADGTPAAYVPVSDHDSDGAFIIYALHDDLYAIFKVDAYLEEYTDELAALGQQVAESVSYEGTATDIITALMSGGVEDAMGEDDDTATDETSSSEGLDGEALVAERCTVCHTADRINNAEKTGDEWAETVDEMIGFGAILTDTERDAVIAYLSGM